MVKILIVEDTAVQLDVMKTLLEQLGQEVVIVKSGKEALDVFVTQNIDLMITDYKMPEMDGVTLVKELRDRDYDTPIVIMTCNPIDEIKEKIQGLDVFNVLQKPLKKKVLCKAIEDAVNNHHRQKDSDTPLKP